MNNQPYFRYDHMTVIERASAEGREALDVVISELSGLNENPSSAFRALVAWLRIRHRVWEEMPNVDLLGIDVALEAIAATADEFFASGQHDVPARAQAFVAGCLDIAGWSKVTMLSLNDPSRDIPGDVHAFSRRDLVMAVEVRAKPVTQEDAIAFIESCSRHSPRVPRAAIVTIGVLRQIGSDTRDVLATLGRHLGVIVAVAEGHEEFLDRVLGWSTTHIEHSLPGLPDAVARRLQEIDADKDSQRLWERLWAESAVDEVQPFTDVPPPASSHE